jgi:CheY-like chemotaxis protein
MKKDIEKCQIRMLIGNIEPNFDHMLSVIIRRRLGNKYDMSFMSVSTGDRLWKLAESHPFDIFILIPNNIIFPRINLTLKERGEKLLKIIAHLRATYGKPVMAMSAFWTKDTSFAKKARLAGVSSYLDMPFKPKEFLEPFCSLLEIELDDGQSC